MIGYINMPDERKPVLIGTRGRTREMLENKTGTEIRIGDSVEIEGDPLGVINARKVIKAISRGFIPSDALKLLEEESVLEIIKLKGTDKSIERTMSRVIGTRGRAKRIIQETTGTRLSIYGKTISIIGGWEAAAKARKAVEMLVDGKPHAGVYKYLYRCKNERT